MRPWDAVPKGLALDAAPMPAPRPETGTFRAVPGESDPVPGPPVQKRGPAQPPPTPVRRDPVVDPRVFQRRIIDVSQEGQPSLSASLAIHRADRTRLKYDHEVRVQLAAALHFDPARWVIAGAHVRVATNGDPRFSVNLDYDYQIPIGTPRYPLTPLAPGPVPERWGRPAVWNAAAVPFVCRTYGNDGIGQSMEAFPADDIGTEIPLDITATVDVYPRLPALPLWVTAQWLLRERPRLGGPGGIGVERLLMMRAEADVWGSAPKAAAGWAASSTVRTAAAWPTDVNDVTGPSAPARGLRARLTPSVSRYILAVARAVATCRMSNQLLTDHRRFYEMCGWPRGRGGRAAVLVEKEWTMVVPLVQQPGPRDSESHESEDNLNPYHEVEGAERGQGQGRAWLPANGSFLFDAKYAVWPLRFRWPSDGW
ncbi:hypothetical protein MIND_01351800 [Mycena indigotica]|uniref:Uncharacterized protein n=1 Tax=Mycena indigotica TaxID=2126181 RepID=A0A8H6RZY3_9AGAR|nr:uncharacterized protein MIND_01351800 [Mycena indigotica]KAF7289778.1 hypothetical protein MIND_01351800 [Mycena indigotica]